MKQTVAQKLTDILDEENVLLNEPMKNHTSFRIGGNADVLVLPKTVKQLRQVLELAKENVVPFCVIGNGSNLLVSDRGIRGIVIQIYRNMSQVSIDGTTVTAQAGILLSRLAKEAAARTLTGLEFAAGIPGTLGGAVVMNAGAYGPEMKDVVTQVTYLDEAAEVRSIAVESCGFGYRTSRFSDNNCIVLEAQMELAQGVLEDIRAKMEDLGQRRSSKQPLELPSAGSTFKRPAGDFAGRLIEEAGLKGFQIGGAAVSEKHSGFVVNLGGATAGDVRALIAHVQRTVKEKFDILLEPEVKMLGDFSDNN